MDSNNRQVSTPKKNKKTVKPKSPAIRTMTKIVITPSKTKLKNSGGQDPEPPKKERKKSIEKKKKEEKKEGKKGENNEKIEEIEEKDITNENEEDEESVEDTKFAEQILTEYTLPYEYHIFDPKEYKYNLHKEIVIVKPENRVTSELMTAYEYTEIVSIRARQIENGGVIFCDDPDGKCEGDPIKFAELEIEQKKCPLSILRMYNLNWGETWQVNEMGIPNPPPGR